MWLSANMDAENGLISLLYQNNVLTVRETESIFCFKDSFQKKDFLLGMLSKKSLEDFEKFLEALDATNQGLLAKQLRKSGSRYIWMVSLVIHLLQCITFIISYLKFISQSSFL